ncbi:A24 family peptidase C-terminal domain-containing protein [Methanococcus voltae]|uniref:Preflagellin peptidase C-terminal domain-containing protein n=2 Tax=Methanococcus voltae TaxID=2188 RepID=A0A8J7RN78_METVO|nr:A24 family peptidase C-terminal domain-containing protein [Methanococcus voltae]MBP2171773.1 hypothetical protein [Methanococcus voltae]MBP2201289.1 hypothetical protein [Methanococcus voltae]MCS3922769.1 hypothetical protein [Methanococcus voltae PS]
MSIEYIYGFFCIIAGLYFELRGKKFYDIFWISMLYLGALIHFNSIEFLGILILTLANYIKSYAKILANLGIVLFIASFVMSGSYYALSLIMYYFIALALYHGNLMDGQETKYLIGLSYLSGFLISSSIFLDSVLFVIPIPLYFLIVNYKNDPSDYEDLSLQSFSRLATSIKKSEKDVKPTDNVVCYDKKSLISAGFKNKVRNPYMNNLSNLDSLINLDSLSNLSNQGNTNKLDNFNLNNENYIDISEIGELSTSMKHKLSYDNALLENSKIQDKKVWVTPHIPFMLFITMSYIIFWFVKKPILFLLIDNLVH